jgi:hypothetical protein
LAVLGLSVTLVMVAAGLVRRRSIISNTQRLEEIEQSRRVFPHRVNSAERARELWAAGARSFEVDVRFEPESQTFGIGHDSGERSGSLDNYLAELPAGELERVWLDVKNLGRDNCLAALRRLEMLDGKYSLKSRAIVESSTALSCFRRFSRQGWRTSHYLPTEVILRLVARGDSVALQKQALEVAELVAKQEISAISFDRRLYPFVTSTLGKLLPKELPYHLWDTSLSFAVPGLVEDLSETAYFGDSRIETIIVPQRTLLEALLAKVPGFSG